MRHVVEGAPAKVNLALHVLGRREDGYHELDGVVAFAPAVADVVRLAPAARWSIETLGPFAGALRGLSAQDNLALRAAWLWQERFLSSRVPLRIVVEKNLPVAAGIGGGSADAAAVLRAMPRLFGVQPRWADLARLALRLGADVPACLASRAARVRGVGEELAPVRLPPLAAVLANPRVALPTATVFSARRATEGGGAVLPPLAGRAFPGMVLRQLRGARNDLQDAACRVQPRVAACLRVLAALPGARLARMSGSGATCFALFDDAAAAFRAARLLRQRRAGWWVSTAMLR